MSYNQSLIPVLLFGLWVFGGLIFLAVFCIVPVNIFWFALSFLSCCLV